MSIQLIRPTPDHLPELARITFQAFQGISNAHNFPLDIPSPDVAAQFLTTLISRPDFYAIIAVQNSKVLGLNFLQLSDPVAGVGPLCIDPSHQSAGIGKLLMKNVIDHALKNGHPMVRLVQDSFNMRSLSLYTSLGFTVQEPLVLMSIPPAESPDPRCRPLTLDDLPACDQLCQLVYKTSRKNELAAMISHGTSFGCIPTGLFMNNHKNAPTQLLTAFLIPGFFGYSAALYAEDLITLFQQTARLTPPPLHRTLLPTRVGSFFRLALKQGFKSIKPMNLMSLGDYVTPTHFWSPSVTY